MTSPAPGTAVKAEGVHVAVIHNLKGGGARRVMSEQIARLPYEVTEYCLATAQPVLPDAVVVPYASTAPRIHPALRPPARYTDFARLVRTWARVAHQVQRSSASVVLAHPCQFLQCPTALAWINKPSIYFCHEPRRVDYEPEASASRSSRTRALYAPMYAMERLADRMAVGHAGLLMTNSQYTADAIQRAYSRSAEVARLGVPEIFLERPDRLPSEPSHVLSVGALIPSKGHDLAIRSVAAAGVQLPLVVVSPREVPSERARLAALAAELGVQLEIRIGISDEALRLAYATALATLYLARDEPYGLVSIEAQACGSPVIVSRQGGLPETLIDGITGWSVRRDADVAGAYLTRLRQADMRTRMGTAAVEFGSSFNWTAGISALAVDIERLARRPIGEA